MSSRSCIHYKDKQIHPQYYMPELGLSKELDCMIMDNGLKDQWFSDCKGKRGAILSPGLSRIKRSTGRANICQGGQ